MAQSLDQWLFPRQSISLEIVIWSNMRALPEDFYVPGFDASPADLIRESFNFVDRTFEYVFDYLSAPSCKLCRLLCFHKREHLPRSAKFRTAEKSEPSRAESSRVECFVGLNKSYAPLITRTSVPSRSANESRQVCITPLSAPRPGRHEAARRLFCQECLPTSRRNSNVDSDRNMVEGGI